MTEEEIIEVLDCCELKDNPAWPSFVLRMKSRLYGLESLIVAWGWYSTGYFDSEKTTKKNEDSIQGFNRLYPLPMW